MIVICSHFSTVPMMMTDYTQLFVYIVMKLLIKLYGFANFVDYHLVPCECASIGLLVIEASSYVVIMEDHYIVR